MTPENFIIGKAVEAIKELYGTEVGESQLQVNVTRKEFEGDYTLVVFPLLKISKTTPENTGNAIGEDRRCVTFLKFCRKHSRVHKAFAGVLEKRLAK